jgi:hypothetical protein
MPKAQYLHDQAIAALEAGAARHRRLAEAAKPFAFIKPFLEAARELGEVEGLEPSTAVIAWEFGGVGHTIRWAQVMELHEALKESR